MKKHSVLTSVLLSLLLMCSAVGCDNAHITADPTPEPTPETTPKPVITADQADVLTETWIAAELSFQTNTAHVVSGKNADLPTLCMDVVFTNRETKRSMKIPAFWYESKKSDNNTFMVRFAPPEYGIWDYVTVCETDPELNGKTGTVGANEYTGDLAIYKHGFVTVDKTKKYFVYDDGTPFFYLGDTHWGMFTEEFDRAGDRADGVKTDSHFKYIVDKRVEQGFTVYQSEPLGSPFNFTDGLQKGDLSKLKEADRYFQYIAEKGLLHANACLFYATHIPQDMIKNTEKLENISRYWVARFGAYPVLWTLAQEIDNDMYAEREKTPAYDYTNNPWVKVAEYMHACDAYEHPLSGHQETSTNTTVTGAGTTSQDRDNNGASVFLSEEVTQKTGHNWWAAQWCPELNKKVNTPLAKDYWNSPKVAIMYESRYCNLMTKDYGARAQGWIAYLSGMYGYGYGCADMWLYKSTLLGDTVTSDFVENITPEDKAIHWGSAVELESAYQVGYMKSFLEKLEWWNLIPDFNDKTIFTPDAKALSVAAHIGQDVYVIYFYDKNTGSGTLTGLDDQKTYTVQWFNPRTGEVEKTLTDQKSINGWIRLDEKPTHQDWTVLVTADK